MSETTERLIYDTTLRDGGQGLDKPMTVEEMIRITRVLIELGIYNIEGGWPVNPTVIEYLERVQPYLTKEVRMHVFCSTCEKGTDAEQDPNLNAALATSLNNIVVVGKAWDFHVDKVIETSLEENLRMVYDSIRYLVSEGKDVVFDAEHFFDGYRDNKKYTMKVLEAAQKAGANLIILCDTCGGTLSWEMESMLESVVKRLSVDWGVHFHNDTGGALENSMRALRMGAKQIQGTLLGIGERCGNLDLLTFIANAQLKMGVDVLPKGKIKLITSAGKTVAQTLNLRHDNRAPWRGKDAWKHMGGQHQAAVEKDPRTYEHEKPEKVGNERRLPVTNQSGRNIVIKMLKKMFPDQKADFDKNHYLVKAVLKEVKRLSKEGVNVNAAPETIAVLALCRRRGWKDPFRTGKCKIDITEGEGNGNHEYTIREILENKMLSTCMSTVEVFINGTVEHEVSYGSGPLHSFDTAMRKALVGKGHFPELGQLSLKDYKVRALEDENGTAKAVSVLIVLECETENGTEVWYFAAVSHDVFKASMIALLQGYIYAIWYLRNRKKAKSKKA